MSLQTNAGGTSYTVKVRARSVAARTYLFGSGQCPYRFEGNLVLVIRIDPEGEPVNIKAQGPGAAFDICSLEPGQVFALALTQLAGVWADNPDADTRVHCAIVPNPVQ